MVSTQSNQLNAAGGQIPRGYAAGSMQKFSPEQLELFKSLFSQVGPSSQLGQLASGSEAGFAPYEEMANRKFQEYAGQLGSRFSGQGIGAQRGSAFKNAQGQAAQDFALQLANQRQQLQSQALGDLMNYSQMLLGQEPEENFLYKQQKKPKWWEQALGVGLPIAGAAAGGYFGGPAGAQLGGQLGGLVGQSFSGQGSPQWQGLTAG